MRWEENHCRPGGWKQKEPAAQHPLTRTQRGPTANPFLGLSICVSNDYHAAFTPKPSAYECTNPNTKIPTPR